MNQNIIRCRRCGDETATPPESHIIPRSFHHQIRGAAKYLWEAQIDNDTTRLIPRQAGMYGRFLCGPCEQSFSKIDGFGFKVFSQKLPRYPRVFDEMYGREVVLMSGVDAGLAKLFLLAILWRASVCGQPFFRHVILESEATKVQEAITLWETPVPKAFPFSIRCITHCPRSIQQPYTFEENGVRFGRVHLPYLVLDVKLNDQPSPLLWRSVHVQGGPVFGLVYHFDETQFRDEHRCFREKFDALPKAASSRKLKQQTEGSGGRRGAGDIS